MTENKDFLWLAVSKQIVFLIRAVYHISLAIRQRFFPSNKFQISRSILLDRSRSLRFFRKDKTRIIPNFIGLIYSHSTEEKTCLVVE